jgi:hypothetical protein
VNGVLHQAHQGRLIALVTALVGCSRKRGQHVEDGSPSSARPAANGPLYDGPVTNSDNPEWWAWVPNGNLFTIQNQDAQQLYVVAESGADLRGTWYYERNAGLAIGPLALGGVTRYGHPTADAAKAAAAEDYRQISWLGEWFSYMVNHRAPG